MSHCHLSDCELRAKIADTKLGIQNRETTLEVVRQRLDGLEMELERRRSSRVMRVPQWVLEVLSAHARKRYDNINPDHRTEVYHEALENASHLLGGEVWPDDIEGEYQGGIRRKVS